MVRTNSDGRTHARTDERTHAHAPNCSCTNYVSLTASRLDNKRGPKPRPQGKESFTVVHPFQKDKFKTLPN